MFFFTVPVLLCLHGVDNELMKIHRWILSVIIVIWTREEERGRGWKKKGYGRREERRARGKGEGIKAERGGDGKGRRRWHKG